MAEPPQGQHAFRVKGREKCIHHKEILKLICLDCQELVCTECVTSLHKRHDFCNLKDKVPEAKEELRTFMDNTEKRDLPEIDEAIISARDMLKKDSNNFDFLENEVKRQLEKLKQGLKLLSGNILFSYQNLRKDNADIVAGYIKGLEIRREEINKLLKECKTVLQSGSHVYMYDLRNEIHRLKPVPVKPILSSTNFTPNKQPLYHLKKSFGTVTTHDGQNYQEQPTGYQRPFSKHYPFGLHQQTSTQQTTGRHQPLSTPKKSKYKLLPRTEVIKEFSDRLDIRSISATKNKSAYVCTGCENKVIQINTKGEVQREIEYKVQITDVRVSPATQHIWTCSNEDYSVMECVPSQKPYKPVVRFNTDNIPKCLCVTVDNCILIGMSKQITKYTTEGKILLTAKRTKLGHPEVRSPCSITECNVTHNVAVVDRDDGSDGNPYVLVMDRNLQEIFRYRGDIPKKYQQTIKWKQLTFDPSDVRYDSVGNLVIGERERGCIHLLSGGGDYLTLIYTSGTWVWRFGIDVNNLLWVVFVDNIKLLQYCNTDF